MDDMEISDQDPISEDIQLKLFKWLRNIWFKPAVVFKEIIAADGKSWWLPLSILSILQLIKSLVEIPARKAATMIPQQVMPNEMQYISPEQQSQIDQGIAFQTSSFFTFILPFVLGLLGIWVIWLILSSLLHISLTLGGSHSNGKATFNITAWASLPLAIRMINQIVSILATKTLINNPGLSGFIDIHGRATMTVSLVLGLIDIFFFLQILYLMIGTTQHSNVSSLRAIITVLIAVGITMLLSIIPGFISYTISGLNITRPFFF